MTGGRIFRTGIAVEHLLSHIAAAVLGEAVGVNDYRSASTGATGAVLACVPDEQHDLPLVALTAALGRRGVQATLLGAATPVATLARVVATRRPAAVVVVLALLGELADPAVFDGLPEAATLIAGGPGWTDADLPPPVRRADDLDEAVRLVVHATGHGRSGSG